MAYPPSLDVSLVATSDDGCDAPQAQARAVPTAFSRFASRPPPAQSSPAAAARRPPSLAARALRSLAPAPPPPPRGRLSLHVSPCGQARSLHTHRPRPSAHATSLQAAAVLSGRTLTLLRLPPPPVAHAGAADAPSFRLPPSPSRPLFAWADPGAPGELPLLAVAAGGTLRCVDAQVSFVHPCCPLIPFF